MTVDGDDAPCPRGKSAYGKKTVLFICTHNSARSQMAEGFLRALYGLKYDAHSAGTEPSDVNPYAVKVMAEVGIDISMQKSKSITEFRGNYFDTIVTVCDHAKETCPYFPGGGKTIHKGFEDPSSFKGTDDETLIVFRQVRDDIKKWIDTDFGRRDTQIETEAVENIKSNKDDTVQKKPCCAAAALRATKSICVSRQQVAISQLDTILEKAVLVSDSGEDAIRKELIRLAKIYNYIPSSAESAYEDALYEEFRKTRGVADERYG